MSREPRRMEKNVRESGKAIVYIAVAVIVAIVVISYVVVANIMKGKNEVEIAKEDISNTQEKNTNAIVTKTEDKKTCTQSGYTESYSCNCTGSWSGGQYHTVCSTCTRYVPTESCTTTPGKTTYSCPSGYKEEGSGSSLKCYKNVTTYSCPSGYISEGSGSNLKCYTVKKTYSCPKEANVKVGSGSSLKCYKVVDGTISYYCKDSSYTLNGTKCTKEEIKPVFHKASCPKGFTMNNENKCINYNNSVSMENGLVCENENSRLEGNMCVIYEMIEAKFN